MARKLTLQFSNHELIRSKYDLYFFEKILRDIVITFRGIDGQKVKTPNQINNTN